MLSDNILRGKRVRLTAVEKKDLPMISSWYEDSGFSRMFDATPAFPKSADQLDHWLEEAQKAKDGYLFAIRQVDADNLLGYIELDGILWPHQSGWLSIGLGKRDDWGKRYGRESMEIALNFAFNELNLFRVQLSVFSYNQRALNLYQNLGFKEEGVIREFIQRDGRRYDMIIFGLLKHEWTEGLSDGR